MKNKIVIFALICCLVTLNVSAQIASGGGFSLEKAVVANGGGESSSGTFNLNGTTGQSAAGTLAYNSVFNVNGGFWTPDQLFPTAATVSVSGKVQTDGGNGIRNALVTLTDSNGGSRTTATGSFGLFMFSGVEVGQTYVLTVRAKKFSFANPSMVISVNEELNELSFVADPN